LTIINELISCCKEIIVGEISGRCNFKYYSSGSWTVNLSLTGVTPLVGDYDIFAGVHDAADNLGTASTGFTL